MNAKESQSLFDPSQAPAYERLARIEGQSNFLSILAGIEAGPDTTQDMGALSFSRVRGAIPEALEAYVAQTELFKLPLMSIVYSAVLSQFNPAEKDLHWVRGAIADAFLLLQRGECKTVESRAKHFRVDKAAYGSMRNLAHGVFVGMRDVAESEFRNALRSIRRPPGKEHSEGGRGDISTGQFIGHIKPRLPDPDDPGTEDFEYRAIAMADRLSWDDRQELKHGPVLTLHGDDAQAHIDAHPSQSFCRPASTEISQSQARPASVNGR